MRNGGDSFEGLAGSYQFTIWATDGGGLASNVSFLMQIRPTKQCQPTLTKPSVNERIFKIPEVKFRPGRRGDEGEIGGAGERIQDL